MRVFDPPSVAIFSAAVLACLLSTTALGLETPFEKSGKVGTPRYTETVAWCEELAAASPILEVGGFGISGEGRGLPLVVADLQGRFNVNWLANPGDVFAQAGFTALIARLELPTS